MVLLLLVAVWPCLAQQAEVALAGPRFLQGSGLDARAIDPAGVPALQRRVSLSAREATLGVALRAIAGQAGLDLMYSRDVVPLEKPVMVEAHNISVAAALTEVLLGTGLDVLVLRGGQLGLVRGPGAQTGTIEGRVTDAGTAEPLVGATVYLEGTRWRAVTVQDGGFRLDQVAAGGYILVARRIGYAPSRQAVTVSDGETVEVTLGLARQATLLDEVVTTVTGDQRRLEVGNTVASIKADSLMHIAPAMSMNDLLQGRAPGVFSLPEGGLTGRAGQVIIRGLNSATVSNAPIVVVDGVRVEATAGTFGGTATSASSRSPAAGVTGRLSDLDPDEIATVEVVKGPSAATLYGTDAANGVIVITTKRGHAGPTRWTVFTEQGLVHQGLDLRDAFPDAYYAFGRNTATNAPQPCRLLARAAGTCVVDSIGSFNNFTHPDTRPFKDGHRQQYGLQVSGGSTDGATYFLSGDYEQETGTPYMPAIDQALIRTTQGREAPEWQVRPNAYTRVNLRANFTAPLGQRGSATLATGFISNQGRLPVLAFPLGQNLVGYRDANDGWTINSGANSRPAYRFVTRQEDVVRRFVGSLATTYRLREWLTLRGTIGTDLSTNAYGTLVRRGEGTIFQLTGARTANELSIARYSLDLGATATRTLSATLSSKTSVGVQYNRRAQRGTNIAVTNLPPGGETIAGGTITGSPAEATLATAVAGGYVEEVLGVRDRLFVTGALRFDGGSAFGRDFKVAVYPKASLSWVVTNGLGPQLPGVSTLRLRTAYGASGVQPGPIDALSRITVESGITPAGTAGPASFLIAGNPGLKPERSAELEAGLDMELWQSRIRVEFTAYQRTSTDALFSRPNAPDVGGVRIENLGSVRNRGLELLLNADVLQSRLFSAGFTATGALNQNRVRRLGEGVVASSPLAEGTRLQEGWPLFGQWGYRIESVSDVNGNGIIEPTEVVLSGPNSSFLGPSFPTREATVAPYLKVAGDRLHLSALLQYRGNFYRFNSAFSSNCSVGNCRAVNDVTTPLAVQARTVARDALGRFGPAIEDGSYVLLRELSLSLTVPNSVVRALGAGSGQVVLAGRNLALLWKASTVALESGQTSTDDNSFAGALPGSSTYWLLRVYVNY